MNPYLVSDSYLVSGQSFFQAPTFTNKSGILVGFSKDFESLLIDFGGFLKDLVGFSKVWVGFSNLPTITSKY